MSTYKYKPLSDPQHDIRLLTLLAGSASEPLAASISHASLIRPQESSNERVALSQNQSTAPPGWTAYETLEGPYIFEHDETGRTSWAHPSTGQDCNSDFVDYPPPGFEPSYEALSYTWGTEQSQHVLSIQQTLESDQSSAGLVLQHLALGKNLFDALQHLRYPDGNRVLWIDAICINQQDMQERNSQVLRMTDVYNLAQRVVVWLGPADCNSSTAVAALRHVGTQVEILKDDLRTSSPDATEPDWYLADSDLRFPETTWGQILQFLQRPWFWRLWIVQEVQLANRRAIVLCGADQISWPRLRRALVCIWHKNKLPSQEIHDTLAKLVSLTINQRELPLGSLLIRNVDRECTNKRDKVYGLLGRAHSSFAGVISPNYALSLADAYKDVMLAYLQHDVRLEPLRYCEQGLRQIDNCPSWVLDWSTVTDQRFLAGQVACGVSRADAEYISPDILRVKGVMCGTTACVGDLAPLNDGAQIATTIRSWEPEGLQTRPYAHGGTLLDAFVTTVCRNNLAERLPEYNYPTIQSWKETYLNDISECPENVVLDRLGKSQIFRCLTVCAGRRFIVTDQGHIGLGPPEVEPGDVLCVLLGFSMPLLLRPHTQRQHAYKIIGTAFVHGLQDSSALLGPLPAPWVVHFRYESSVLRRHQYLNTTTGLSQHEDPRLPPFTDGWKRLPLVRKPDDPNICDRFFHAPSGQSRDSDPRLDAGALKARGVALRDFELV